MNEANENLEAEQAFLGALLSNNGVLHLVTLDPDDFSEPVHARIFSAAALLINDGRLATAVTLKSHFENDVTLKEIGGTAYLARLVANATTIINAQEYAMIIRDLAIRRRTVTLMRGTIEDLAVQSADSSTQISGAKIAADLSMQLSEIASSGIEERTRYTMKEAIIVAIDQTALAYQNNGVRPDAVATGIKALDNIIGGLVAETLVIVAGRPSMGKQQPLTAKVLTPNGWVQIGIIKAGDFVIGSSGHAVRVRGVYPQGISIAYQVKFSDGGSTECGESHLWTVYPNGGRSASKPRTVSLGELMSCGLRQKKKNGRFGAKWRIPVVGPVEFVAGPLLPIEPYVLGVLIGDGATGGKNLRFSNPDMDSDIRVRVAGLLPQDLTLKEGRFGQACPYYTFVGQGQRSFRQEIKSLGLNVGSRDKFIPEIYMRASVDQRKELLQGLMDTDGSSASPFHMQFYTTSERLAYDVRELARSLGCVVRLSKYDRSKVDKPTEYVLRIRSSFCPFSTSRKAKNWSAPSLSRYIREVQPINPVEQVCISVEADDGLYVTDDYIVTHNTTMGSVLAYNAAKAGVRTDFYSLDMTVANLAQRLGSIETKTPYERMQWGRISEQEFIGLTESAKQLAALPLTIIARAGLSLAGFEAAIAKSKMRHPDLFLVIIDQLSQVTIGGKYIGQRMNEIAAITAALKAIAIRYKVCVVLLHQLSRAADNREGNRPQLSDLRDSGSLEQDANVVLFPFREEYYLARANPKQGTTEFLEWQEKMDLVSGVMEIIVAKNSMGRIGSAKVSCDLRINFISDLAETQETLEMF